MALGTILIGRWRRKAQGKKNWGLLAILVIVSSVYIEGKIKIRSKDYTVYTSVHRSS
jgi:hypothetical protein